MTSTETRKNFLGIPIEGDTSGGARRAVQRPLSDLEPIMRAVLDDPTVVEFGWKQYTPYFNDGDTCTFGVGDVWLLTTTDEVEDLADAIADESLSIGYGHPSLGRIEWDWQGVYPDRRRVFVSYEGPDQARMERCTALASAIGSGAFNDVLLDAFGDHANVRISRTGIKVDTYEHD
jgi:hypothetical protein